MYLKMVWLLKTVHTKPDYAAELMNKLEEDKKKRVKFAHHPIL